MLSGGHYPNAEKVQVRLPYKWWSKGQLVDKYLAAGHPPEFLSKTVSCYHPVLEHCGRCKACIRKWIALAGNAVDKTHWSFPPWEAEIWPDIVAKILAPEGVWRCKAEDSETLEVLATFRPDLLR